jgi:pyruvate dehydrogenase E2 component (dihydrolipoamide acetyltransferase)
MTNLLRVKASPLARKIAESRGLDLRGKAGTGPNGRVIVRDLEALSQPIGRVAPAKVREDHKVPLSMMRKTIAKRLLQGKNEAPHFYLKQSASMEQMLEWREKLNKDREAKKLSRISINDMMILAVSRALRDHPGVNASWQGDFIVEYGQINVAMAVALPGGLVTPVIRNADQLSLSEISQCAKDLGSRAKDGKLTNDDYAGGTFTISNLGMTGIEEFTAIINPPQAAILAIGKTMLVPWVKGSGELGVQNRVKLTLSCDHRVIDGMVGALFMETLVKYIETPVLMFS